MTHPTGISDEAAIESHDLIHNAEIEEQKLHGDHALTQPDMGEQLAGMPEQKPKKESMVEKIKDALNMKKA